MRGTIELTWCDDVREQKSKCDEHEHRVMVAVLGLTLFAHLCFKDFSHYDLTR